MRYKIVRPNTSVEKIKEVIKNEQQKMFPIVSKDEMFLGYILEQDIMGEFPAGTTAVDVFKTAMQAGKPRAVSVHDDDTFDKAVIAMTANCLPFVPVVEPNGRYAGTIDSASVASTIQR